MKLGYFLAIVVRDRPSGGNFQAVLATMAVGRFASCHVIGCHGCAGACIHAGGFNNSISTITGFRTCRTLSFDRLVETSHRSILSRQLGFR